MKKYNVAILIRVIGCWRLFMDNNTIDDETLDILIDDKIATGG